MIPSAVSLGPPRAGRRDPAPNRPVSSSWLLPLCGVASVVLIVAAFAATGTAPADDAPATEVASFYARHAGGQQAGGALLGLGALLFLVFSAGLAGGQGRRPERWCPAVLTVAGGVLVTAGLAIFGALSIATGAVAGHIEPAAVQALHVLNQDLFVPLTIGTSAFLLGAGALAMQHGNIPRWLGRVAVVFGLLAAVPSHVVGGAIYHIGFFAFAGLGLWTLAVSFMLVRPRHGG